MPDLVVLEPGLQLTSNDGKLEVRRGDEVVARQPQQQVSGVFLATGVGVSASVVAMLRQQRVPLIWTSERGDPLSWRTDADFRHSALRLRQAEAVLDPEHRVGFARAILQAKLVAMGAHPSRLPAQASATELSTRRSLSTLRGVEGDAARRYFKGFWKQWPREWRPTRRSKRPAMDPANALLSFGYGMLSSWMLREVLVAGLEPGWGFLHATHSGMPSLTQDLIEPFRASLVDPWALSLASTGELGLDDFEQGDRGCRISSSQVRKRVVVSFLRKLDEPLPAFPIQNSQTARKALRAIVRETTAALNQRRFPTFLG